MNSNKINQYSKNIGDEPMLFGVKVYG